METKPPDIIAVCGRPQHGKSRLSQLLSRELCLKSANTSDAIYHRLAETTGESVEGLLLKPKEEIRGLLIRTGDSMCKDQPDALAIDCIRRGARIIAGIRKPDELHALKQKFSVFVVWVNRTNYQSATDNTLLNESYANWIVSNTTMQSLVDAARRIAAVIRIGTGPGPGLWQTLHGFAHHYHAKQVPKEAFVGFRDSFLKAFAECVAAAMPQCNCGSKFRDMVSASPPPDTPEEFLEWTLVMHDAVNLSRGAPRYWGWTPESKFWTPLTDTLIRKADWSRCCDK